MRVGVPKELRAFETRVAMTPDLVTTLAAHGHAVTVETDAGVHAGFSDAQFRQAGANIAPDALSLWQNSQLIVKVKEPEPSEFEFLRDDLVVFSYLHLAAAKDCFNALLASGCTALAFETVQTPDGGLPLLAPMSAIAGRLAAQFGADFLTSPFGGKGVLLGGITGVDKGNVVVIGAGTAGQHAATVASGLGASVTLVDRNPSRLTEVAARYRGVLATLVATDQPSVDAAIVRADIVIGAALVPGARAPIVVTDNMLSRMEPGSVMFDIAIDQGGNYENAMPTSYAEPVRRNHDVQVAAIPNLPAAVPRSATHALVSAITPYVVAVADLGWRAATAADPALQAGVNVTGGRVILPALLTP